MIYTTIYIRRYTTCTVLRQVDGAVRCALLTQCQWGLWAMAAATDPLLAEELLVLRSISYSSDNVLRQFALASISFLLVRPS